MVIGVGRVGMKRVCVDKLSRATPHHTLCVAQFSLFMPARYIY